MNLGLEVVTVIMTMMMVLKENDDDDEMSTMEEIFDSFEERIRKQDFVTQFVMGI